MFIPDEKTNQQPEMPSYPNNLPFSKLESAQRPKLRDYGLANRLTLIKTVAAKPNFKIRKGSNSRAFCCWADFVPPTCDATSKVLPPTKQNEDAPALCLAVFCFGVRHPRRLSSYVSPASCRQPKPSYTPGRCKRPQTTEVETNKPGFGSSTAQRVGQV